MSVNLTHTSIITLPGDLWDEALKKAKFKNKSALIAAGLDKRQILGEILKIVQQQEFDAQKKKWKFRKRDGQVIIVRDIFAKLVVWIEKFKAVGDNLVQYDPAHAALPWAAVRFLLQAAVSDIHINGAILEGIEAVINILARYEIVEYLYLQGSSNVSDLLRNAIIKLYTAILEYLQEAYHYFEQHTIVKIANSIFQPEASTNQFLANIKQKEQDVDKHLGLVLGGTLTGLVEKIDTLEGSMQNLQLDVSRIKGDTLDQKKIGATLKDLMEPIHRIATQLSNINDNLNESERMKLFQWLTNIQSSSHHRNKLKTLMSGTCQWLFEKKEFEEWMKASTSSILWLHGIPGSGKSMLVCSVIEYLQRRARQHHDSAPIAYFYCARTVSEPERADPGELLRNILEQLCSSDSDTPIREPVSKAYLTRKKEARGRIPEKLDLGDSVDIILELLESNPATIVIDGLDECDPLRRNDLLIGLQRIITNSNNIVKVFVSSRDDQDLVHRLAQTPNLYIHATDNSKDIEKFVYSRLDEAVREGNILCGRVSDQLKDTITRQLVTKANGMFRLVSLHIESLCNPQRVKTEANIQHALANLPGGLKQSYDATMSQILNSETPNPQLANRTLKWLLCAREPMTSRSFRYAICADRLNQNLLSIDEILSICCNLVVYDTETDRFQFAHLSVREYLEGFQLTHSSKRGYLEVRDEYSVVECNHVAAELCISWMFSVSRPSIPEKSRELEVKSLSILNSHATRYWGEYSKAAAQTRQRGRLGELLAMLLLPTPVKFGVAGPTVIEKYLQSTDRVDRSSLYFVTTPSQSKRKQPVKWILGADPSDDSFGEEAVHIEPASPRSNLDPESFKSRELLVSIFFVVVRYDLIEYAPELLLYQNSAQLLLTGKNAYGLTSGQIASFYNNQRMINLLHGVSREHRLPNDYWHMALRIAILECSINAIRAILENEGNDFVMIADLEFFLSRNVAYTSGIQYTILDLLLQNTRLNSMCIMRLVYETNAKRELQWDTGKIISMIRSKEICVDLDIFNCAMENIYEPIDALHSILISKKSLVIETNVLPEVIRFIEINAYEINDTIESWIEKISNRKDPFRFEPADINNFFSQYLMEVLFSISSPRKPRKLNGNGRIPSTINWKIVVMATTASSGRDDLLALLKDRFQLTPEAVNFILSLWDSEIVTALLAYNTVKITNEVIRSVAGNLKHGNEIIKLLLDREMDWLE